MRLRRRHLLSLAALVVVAVVAAQVAGVGGSRGTAKHRTTAKVLALVPGGAVPDITSTTLASTSVKAKRGETLRMRSSASLRTVRLRAGRTAQVVCGIRYSRAGDPSWTLGTPYETVTLARAGARKTVRLERTLETPARDTYRMSSTCHVVSPETGVRITATGTMRGARGLPKGAAKPA